MVTLETQVKIKETQPGKDTVPTEEIPLFYSVPRAGVRYYTYDYRPALRKMAARWSPDPEEKRTA
jgi:hypothetical protein